MNEQLSARPMSADACRGLCSPIGRIVGLLSRIPDSLIALIGLATRFSAPALLGMALVIQVFVYPDAYPTHGVWMTVLLFLVARGGGAVSLDHWLGRCLSGKCA